jgi:sirohydrochlorin cobaltochelatase
MQPAAPVGLDILNARIDALLPPRYRGCFEQVPTTSMGSAELKYGPDGRVAWDEIWTTFCHLAIAGGPPHRGGLLLPVSADEAQADPENHRTVVAEIERAIRLTTGLSPVASPTAGWVGVRCRSAEMAAWLQRAVVAENVTARRTDDVLWVPAGPRFRLAKEIKNVVTALAKTCHYWCDHMSAGQRQMGLADADLLEPALPDAVQAAPEQYEAVVAEIERAIRAATGLPVVRSAAPGWLGVKCSDDEMAVWLLRAILIEHVLVRRENNVLYLPAAASFAHDGAARRVVAVLAMAWYYYNAS